MPKLPETMRCLQLQAIDGSLNNLELHQKSVPFPKSGQVLIQVAASPCNPSDLMFLKGLYGVRKSVPIVPGMEASGVVVAAGPGLVGQFMIGKKVAFVGADKGDGTWAEYA